jgi:hypothetical protein
MAGYPEAVRAHPVLLKSSGYFIFAAMKKFIIPKIKSRKPVAAVYKMSFDCGGFYIGGSTNIKQRMWGWKFRLEAGIKKNERVTAAFLKTKKVVFEIIETVDDPASVKFREDVYIKQYWGRELLLNRAPNAFDGTGMRWTSEQLAKKPIFKTCIKPVGKFDKGGNLIKEYESRLAAAIDNNVDTQRIRKCLKKYGHTVNGFVYKQKDANGNYIEAPVVAKKPRPRGIKFSEIGKKNMRAAQQKRIADGRYMQPDHSKPMLKYDLDGNKITEFPSIGAAAKSMGADPRNFKRQLKKGRPGYYKGFIWKYAEQ